MYHIVDSILASHTIAETAVCGGQRSSSLDDRYHELRLHRVVDALPLIRSLSQYGVVSGGDVCISRGLVGSGNAAVSR